MSKDLSLPNLYKDLGYIIYGTEAHQFLFSIFPPKKYALVLEMGCGSGKLGIAYAMKGCFVTLCDIDPDAIQYAIRLRTALSGLISKTVDAYIERNSIFEATYHENDFVFNEGVPQHWPDEGRRQGAINNMVKAAKIGGIVCVMGNNGLRKEEQEADQYFEFQYEGMPPHRKCFKPDELAMRLEKAGLHDVQVAAVSPLVPIEVSYLIAGWGVK